MNMYPTHVHCNMCLSRLTTLQDSNHLLVPQWKYLNESSSFVLVNIPPCHVYSLALDVVCALLRLWTRCFFLLCDVEVGIDLRIVTCFRFSWFCFHNGRQNCNLWLKTSISQDCFVKCAQTSFIFTSYGDIELRVCSRWLPCGDQWNWRFIIFVRSREYIS
jgi:hypothetical protein